MTGSRAAAGLRALGVSTEAGLISGAVMVVIIT